MITLYKYHLKLHKAFTVTGRSYLYREGLILRYRDGEIDIVSEVAPLPGFSHESTDQALAILAAGGKEIARLLRSLSSTEQLNDLLEQKPYPPSVQFGISCLGLHLLSLNNPGALTALTLPDPAKRLRVNAVLGQGTEEQIRSGIESSYAKGFRTIKIKCGSGPGNLPAILKEMQDRYPGLTFRIDANRSWPKKNTPDFVASFSGLPVEYIEEPFGFEHLSEFLELKKQSPVPLALDESIGNIRRLRRIVKSGMSDVVILKPMILGNILKLFETFSSAESHTIERVCTTTLESGIGRSAVAMAASRLGSKHLAHGLDTGRLMQEDLYREPAGNGWIDSGGFGWCIPYSLCRKNKLYKIDVE